MVSSKPSFLLSWIAAAIPDNPAPIIMLHGGGKGGGPEKWGQNEITRIGTGGRSELTLHSATWYQDS